MASSSVTAMTSSRMARLSTPDTNLTPRPGMLWIPTGLPDSTAAPSGPVIA